MKNLENFGVQKLNKNEIVGTNGGEVDYIELASPNGNPVYGIGVAVYNAGAIIGNAGIWFWNQF